MDQIYDVNALYNKMDDMLGEIQKIEIANTAAIQNRLRLEQEIERLKEKGKNDQEALDIATHAIEIIRQVSDEAVSKAYKFLETSLNSTLERMFANTTRKIKIREYTRGNQYPQLELELEVGNGIKRSLKTDSGHGLAQVVSLLSILSLIVITNSRRILVMDEVISGLSVHNRKVVSDILWSFTEIGFQFLINDHGFIPEHSKVYHLEMVGDVSHVKQTYIAEKGVYLQGGSNDNYDYSLSANEKISAATLGTSTEDMEGMFDTDDIPDSSINTEKTEEVENKGSVSTKSDTILSI